MSKAAPIINNRLRHKFDTTKIDLPRESENYAVIFEKNGFGDFHSAKIKFNSDSILFKCEIDGFTLCEFSIDDLNSFLGYSGNDDDDDGGPNSTSFIGFNNSTKFLNIGFRFPLQFKESIRFLAKADSSSTKRECEGYSILITEDET